MSTTNPTWEFYYNNSDNPNHDIIVTTKQCKCPRRTGTWKVLKTWCNHGDRICSIGYRKV